MAGSSITTGIPQAGSPFTDPANGVITPPWFRLLTGFFTKLGGGAPSASAVYFQEINGEVFAYNAGTQEEIGPVGVGSGEPGVVQVLGASPFSFTATGAGTLLADGGTVTITRGGSTFPTNSASAGGAFPLLPSDTATISWSGGAPNVTWLPT